MCVWGGGVYVAETCQGIPQRSNRAPAKNVTYHFDGPFSSLNIVYIMQNGVGETIYFTLIFLAKMNFLMKCYPSKVTCKAQSDSASSNQPGLSSRHFTMILIFMLSAICT